jgi:hypothetical protein
MSEETTLEALVFGWALNDEERRQQWLQMLRVVAIDDLNELMLRAGGSFWNNFLNRVGALDDELATKLERWYKQTYEASNLAFHFLSFLFLIAV